jgi:outer membrane protein, protease secretion system
MDKSFVLPLLTCILFSSAACATEVGVQMAQATSAVVPAPSKAQALTPAAALVLALAHEARFQAAKANLRAESQAVDLARSAQYPSIALNANRTYNQLYPASGRQQDYVSSTTGVSLRQSVYRPETQALVDQARAEVTRQQALLGSERNRLSLEVATAYLEALRAQADWQAQQSQQQALEGLVAAAQRAQPLGLVSVSMVQERQAKAAQGKLRILQAQTKRSDAVIQLEKLVGQPVRHMLSLPDEGFSWRTDAPVLLADWQQRARTLSPEVQAAQAAIEATRKALVRLDAARWPTLDLVAGRNRIASETPTSINNRYMNTTVGLQLAVPIYDGGRNSAAMSQAVAQLDRATAQLEGVQRDLDSQIENAYQLLAQAGERLQAHQVVVAAAQQAVLAARQGQSRGQQSALDVQDAQALLEAARLEQRTTQWQLMLTQTRLHGLAGDEEWLSLVPLQNWLVQSISVER